MFVEAQNSVLVDMGGYQSATGPMRRKLDVDLFLAQIRAIFKSCFMSMPKLVFLCDDALHHAGIFSCDLVSLCFYFRLEVVLFHSVAAELSHWGLGCSVFVPSEVKQVVPLHP